MQLALYSYQNNEVLRALSGAAFVGLKSWITNALAKVGNSKVFETPVLSSSSVHLRLSKPLVCVNNEFSSAPEENRGCALAMLEARFCMKCILITLPRFHAREEQGQIRRLRRLNAKKVIEFNQKFYCRGLCNRCYAF